MPSLKTYILPTLKVNQWNSHNQYDQICGLQKKKFSKEKVKKLSKMKVNAKNLEIDAFFTNFFFVLVKK